jgi:hypothetical protein
VAGNGVEIEDGVDDRAYIGRARPSTIRSSLRE